MNRIRVIALTHHNTGLEGIAPFFIDEERRGTLLGNVKENLDLSGLFYLGTCNRVELYFSSESNLDDQLVRSVLQGINPDAEQQLIEDTAAKAGVYSGKEAVNHLFEVAASLDSMVVGEREIITQVRKNFELSRKAGLSDDILRLLVERTIETAKDVYTKTGIGAKPVSVVSLAYRKLKAVFDHPGARVIMIGAGKTNSDMLRFLQKLNVGQVDVFNRTKENAINLAGTVDGTGHALEELKNWNRGFDILVSCTGSEETLLDAGLYRQLAGSNCSGTIAVDLALPGDIAADVGDIDGVQLIGLAALKEEAAQNIKKRENYIRQAKGIIDEHLDEFEKISKARALECALKGMPAKVKEIRHRALDQVFADELKKLSEKDQAFVNKLVDYLEKKYIAEPMKMVRTVLVDQP